MLPFGRGLVLILALHEGIDFLWRRVVRQPVRADALQATRRGHLEVHVPVVVLADDVFRVGQELFPKHFPKERNLPRNKHALKLIISLSIEKIEKLKMRF